MIGPQARGTFDPVTTGRRMFEAMEQSAALPPGSKERFQVFAVMGLPFASGDVLALRRIPTSSVGAGYASIWHRNPEGAWTFYSSVEPRTACPRYFGSALTRAVQTEIRIAWLADDRLRIEMPAVPFVWEIALRDTGATRMMNALGRVIPQPAWRSAAFLRVMSAVAGPLLGVGRVALQGRVPNGQHFIANPRVLWAVSDSRAVLRGVDFGPPAPLTPQARLGDFWITQRGIVAVGQTYFDPFDPARHSSDVQARAASSP